MSRRELAHCHPVRTAIGTCGGSLKPMPAAALGAAVAIRRNSIPRRSAPSRHGQCRSGWQQDEPGLAPLGSGRWGYRMGEAQIYDRYR